MPVDREALRAWVAASCAAQGVPVLVTDPGVIAAVGALVNERGPARGLPAGSPAPDPTVTVSKSE